LEKFRKKEKIDLPWEQQQRDFLNSPFFDWEIAS